MRALVAGGAGYIGSHTCKALAAAGHEVLVYDNLSTGHRQLTRWGDFVHGDILDTQALRSTMKNWRPDVVYHFAAFTHVGESVLDPGKYYRNNALGTLSLLEAMRHEDVGHIVVSGTCAVYGDPQTVPIGESAPRNPINPYGVTKMVMERLLEDFATAHGLHWTSLRYFNAAGADPDGETGELHMPETHLVPRVILAALGILPEVRIFGNDYPTPDGTCVRDYIHVNDLASAHIVAGQHLLAGGESLAVNLGTGRGASVLEIVKGIEEISGAEVRTALEGRRSGDAPVLVADATLARQFLGWTPRYGLGEMLGHAWEFVAAHRDFFREQPYI